MRWRDQDRVGSLGMHCPQQRMLLVRVIGLFGHRVGVGAAK